MALTDELKALFRDIATKFKGHERRTFMAQVVRLLGKGGQRRSERELGWNRGTIRKGMYRDSVLNLNNYISRYAQVPSICRTAGGNHRAR